MQRNMIGTYGSTAAHALTVRWVFAKEGKVTKEITVEFDFTGRIERSEYRRNGEWFERHHVMTDFTTADVHVATLNLFKR